MAQSYPGLVYRKFDLHVHTPASGCFDDKSVSASDIVAAALGAGLQGIAITDHNSGAFVDAVKAAAKGQGLIVFPGVEIHAAGGKGGIHVIALLDPSRGTKDIESLLAKVGLNPDDYGDSKKVAGPVAEVLKKIESIGGVAVLAHVNSSKGAIADMQGEQRTKLFKLEELRAVEATAGDFSKPAGQRVVDYLSGNDPTYNNRRVAVYVASDNPELANGKPNGRHTLGSIGSLFSYFKTEAQPTIESLRQCFIDPEVRIRLPKGMGDESPDEIEPYPHVLSVSVNDGFLKDQEFVFHPGLNTVVGPKGSGKSLLVELMRFAMNRRTEVPQISEDHSSKLEKRLGLHGEVVLRVGDRTGAIQEIRREYDPSSRNPYEQETMLDKARDFPVLFLSQGEMVRIAEDAGRQMAFLDTFFDFHTYVERIAALEEGLAELDSQLATAIRDQKAIQAAKRRVDALTERIAQLDETLKDPDFREYYRQKSRLAAADRLVTAIADQVAILDNASAAIGATPVLSLPDALAKDPNLRRMLGTASASKTEVQTALKAAQDTLRGHSQTATGERQKIARDHAAAHKRYVLRARELGGNQKELSAEREMKQGELEKEQQKLERLTESAGTVNAIAKTRSGKLDELDAVYAEYRSVRQSLCERISADSGGKVRVSVAEQGNRGAFKQRLQELKVGSYVSAVDIDAITAGVTPKHLIASILNYDLRTKKREEPLSRVADAAGVDIATMTKLADHILSARDYEEILRFQYEVTPSDLPEIEVNTGDGHYSPIDEASTGQKCTGLIVIALCATDGPVIIDQPEDSLDITGIWDDICKTFRRSKDRQQFIITSHSSNLAVASDTDCYSILKANATSATIVHVGSLDGRAVRADVLKVLEGGPQAYDLKSKKYGLRASERT